ncbi:uncharacterized protein LOC108669498 [Hyalella azteca]|uniref:Uncharacterized protein LOC108669498 n=1 Tax=Hyalella azteca TaxID=294128 RepID=A0A8B7NFE4_HYAAZ|nr:uncharacterized protein LOC108669498 [Hyalella azteca]
MKFLEFWCLLVFITSIIRSEKGVAGAGDFRYLTGYVGLNQTGAHYQFTEYMPDLSVVQMDNSIQSACGVGIWLLYDEVNYDPITNETECTVRPIGECGNWSPQCQNMVSSLRYAGSPYGLNDNYYNLYEGTYFRGREFRGNTNAADLGDLDMAVSSLIVTGQSGWTFYTDVNLTGSNVCVYADEHHTNGDIDHDFARVQGMEKLGLPDNSIRSVARGCLSEYVLGHPGGERRSHDASN